MFLDELLPRRNALLCVLPGFFNVKIMRISKILSSGVYRQYNIHIAESLTVNASILLSYLISLSEKFEGKEFYCSGDKISKYTALSHREIRTAIELILKKNLIKRRIKGTPPTAHFRFDFECENEILNLLNSENPPDFNCDETTNQFVENAPLICRNGSLNLSKTHFTPIYDNIKDNIYVETPKKEQITPKPKPKKEPELTPEQLQLYTSFLNYFRHSFSGKVNDNKKEFAKIYADFEESNRFKPDKEKIDPTKALKLIGVFLSFLNTRQDFSYKVFSFTSLRKKAGNILMMFTSFANNHISRKKTGILFQSSPDADKKVVIFWQHRNLKMNEVNMIESLKQQGYFPYDLSDTRI